MRIIKVLFMLFCSCFFFTININKNETIVINSDYNYKYSIQEKNNSIIRKYVKGDTSQEKYKLSTNNNHLKIKSVLSSLGMDDEVIDDFSNEKLQEYDSADMIITTSQYLKLNDEGYEVVTKEEVDTYISRVAPILPIFTDPGDGDDPNSETLINEYLHMLFTVAYLGDGTYKFSIDVLWKTQPDSRKTDFLGACAQNFTVENSTRYGWIKYKRIVTSADEIISENQETESLSNFLNTSNSSNWTGSVVQYQLPLNYSQGNDDHFFGEFRIYYEYEGKVNYPSLPMNFNVSATYIHTYDYLSIGDFSLSIDSEGGFAGSLSISMEEDHNEWTLEFPDSLYYNPEEE